MRDQRALELPSNGAWFRVVAANGLRKALCSFAACLATSVLAACSSSPELVELNAASDYALLLLQVEPAEIPVTITIVGYDRAQQMALESPLGGYYSINLEKRVGQQFMYLSVRPGTYVYQAVVQQLRWAVCFHENTLSFTVRPGEVVVLGSINPTMHINDLSDRARNSFQTMAGKYDVYHYFDDISPPQVTPPEKDPSLLSRAKAFVASSMPKVRGDVKGVTYSSARFGTGFSLFGQRLCGGYFKQSVTAAKP